MHKIRNSQQRFTPGVMNMTKKSVEYPEMRGKVFNAAVVTLWLNEEMRSDPQAAALERACLEGISGVLGLMHRSNRTVQLTDSEANSFFEFGQGHLIAYAHLAQEAQDAGRLLWPVRPKHHMFSHLVSLTRESRARPGWAFADEDFNGLLLVAHRGASH